jgi:hypothetical protein
VSKLLVDLLDKKLETSPNHPVSRLLRRQGGSYVEGIGSISDLRQFFSNIKTLKEVRKEDLPRGVYTNGCRYYTAFVPKEYIAYVCVTSLDMLDVSELDSVRIKKKNNGGYELVCNVQPQPTEKLSFIADERGLRTWYPGPFSSKHKTSNLSADTVVKGIAPK